MTANAILTVGSLNMDQVIRVSRLPVRGETLLGSETLSLVPGGKGAHEVVAMDRLGVWVSMAGRVGRDGFGDHLVRTLHGDGLDTSLLVVDEQVASGVACIFLLPEGDNAIVVVPGANGRVGKDEEQLRQVIAALPSFRALILQMEIPVETVIRLVAAAREANVPVILNLAPAYALPLETLRQLDTLVVNAGEGAFLHNALAPTAVAPPGSLDAATNLAVTLSQMGIARRIAITLGEQGALLIQPTGSGEPETSYQAPPRVRVADTTAAGDCFVGALTGALLEGRPARDALRFAVYSI